MNLWAVNVKVYWPAAPGDGASGAAVRWSFNTPARLGPLTTLLRRWEGRLSGAAVIKKEESSLQVRLWNYRYLEGLRTNLGPLMMQDGFLYIATNESMPGLVKVGRTEKPPTERMSELHTTGVPTPFELQFVAQVNNSRAAELKAHTALASCRLTRSREFFRIDVLTAVAKIIEVIGSFEVDWTHTQRQPQIAKIEQKFQERQKREQAAAEEARKAQKSELFARGRHIKSELSRIEIEQKRAQAALAALGRKPEAKGMGCLVYVVGCIALGAFAVHATSNALYFWVAMGLGIFLGFGIFRHSDAGFEKQVSPWRTLEIRLDELRREALPLDKELEVVRRAVATLPQPHSEVRIGHVVERMAVSPSTPPDSSTTSIQQKSQPPSGRQPRTKTPQVSRPAGGTAFTMTSTESLTCLTCHHSFRVTIRRGEQQSTCPECFASVVVSKNS